MCCGGTGAVRVFDFYEDYCNCPHGWKLREKHAAERSKKEARDKSNSTKKHNRRRKVK